MVIVCGLGISSGQLPNLLVAVVAKDGMHCAW